jgi:hypothetical protein
MTELKAHLLVFVTALIVLAAICLALGAMQASGTAYAVATVVIIALAADTSSRIVMHYWSREDREH